MTSDEIKNEIIKEEKREIRIYDNRIEQVAEKMTKMGISKEKAKEELKIMILMGMLINKHRAEDHF